jgi:phosphopantothenoylcysteine decarboxylase/phosphopantothenate--cysteine ligase
MANFLANKRVLLGVTGSIAAYKSADLVRRLREAGAKVRVVMTENAKRFITPLTMQAVSGFPVHDDLFDLQAEAAMGHIELARWADAIMIAPASADCMARLVSGKADDLLTSLCLATRAVVAIAPAMNQGMWQHISTQHNLQVLEQKQIHILGPAEGSQACGDVGFGRMLEPAEIVDQLSQLFSTGILAGLKVLITAGPTHEAIDPVRYISNGSSGKMGYAMAEAAREAGANVLLVSGPVAEAKPLHMDVVSVVSAQEMHDAVMKDIKRCDIFISVAAVADYRAETTAKQKLHKNEAETHIKLVRNPDITAMVSQLTPKPFVVGFAAETEDVIAQAKAKRQRKNMDMIIANQVGGQVGIGSEDNEVVVLTSDTELALPLTSKRHLARQLISLIASEFNQRKLI